MSELAITLDGEAAPRRLQCEPGCELWLGRDPGCAVVLGSEIVSRRHAYLRRHGALLTLEDRSANGTRIDGALVRGARRELQLPALIEIGPHRLQVGWTTLAAAPPPVTAELRRRIQRRLIDHLDLARLHPSRIDRAELQPKVVAALERICAAHAAELPPDHGPLIAELTDEALGLGPLEQLLTDPDVGEIMVVDPQTIYVERRGVIEPTALRFTDAEAVRATIERIVTPLGRRIDESAPLCDARLPDGSRVNAIIPPLASKGPCITIRKFTAAGMTFEQLIAAGSVSREIAEFLRDAVRARRNLVIAGGTGSGKTTLLNLLSSAIPERERIVTIEDAAELKLEQRHVVSLEARPQNLEGKGAYTIRDLVRNALRMRPDRIIVGECRGGEAIDMLQAMNTGHEGSMTTTHANSPREALARLEVLCLMAGLELPVRAIRQQIAASVHLVVQQTRFADGSRRVSSIGELLGVDEHGDLTLRELYRYDRGAGEHGEGAFVASGYLPSFAGALRAARGGQGEGSASP